MSQFFKYGIRRSVVVRWVLVGSSAMVLTVAAHAQAQASNETGLSYAMSVDAGSIDPASDLNVTDGGIHTYNTIQPGSTTPYMNSVGPGALAFAGVSNLTGFDLATLSGSNDVSSSASVSQPSSSAVAEVGSEEHLTLTDTGSNSITLVFDVNASFNYNASASSSGGLAAGEGYAGIYVTDEATSNQIDLHLITLNSDAFATPNYSVVGTWSQPAGGDYSAQYSITVNSGQLVRVIFYSDAFSHASAVPTPSGCAALGFGLTGLALRRRIKNRSHAKSR